MQRAAVLVGLLAGCALAPWPALAQAGNGADVAIQGYIFEPIKLNPTETRIQSLKVPEGFKVEVFARDLINPRILVVAPNGTVYVSRRSVGDVVMLKDGNGDGRADQAQVVATRPQMHGLAIEGNAMYLVTHKDVYRAEIKADGTLAELERIINDLPDAGQHPNRTLKFGPDRQLYISVGSTCNACPAETSPESATLLRAKPDGSSRTIFASGLRNTIGFDWHPETGALYGWDHGIDWLGNDLQVEEINRIEQGKMYGWPIVHGFGDFNPQDEPPNGISMETWKKLSTEPVLGHTAHSAGMQLMFYTGSQFPPEYRGDAFVTLRGSWNRKPASGYEVVRIRFENGQPKSVEPFVTGFLTEENGRASFFGRPVGLGQMPDGSLLFTDDVNGVIYRVSYQAGGAVPERRAEVAPRRPSTADEVLSLGDTAAASLVAQAQDRTRQDQRVLQGDRQGGGPDVVERERERDTAREQNRAQGQQQTPAPPARDDGVTLAIETPALNTGEALAVTSPAFKAGERIPHRYTEYGERISPPLAWTGAPQNTRSFVVVMEDPDAEEPKPFVHWLAYNIPAEVTSLPEGLPTAPRLLRPDGVLQGTNSRNAPGYMGPRPPEQGPAHRYHLQVFALDTMLTLDPAVRREQLLAAIQGRVIARGEIVGTSSHDLPKGVAQRR